MRSSEGWAAGAQLVVIADKISERFAEVDGSDPTMGPLSCLFLDEATKPDTYSFCQVCHAQLAVLGFVCR